MQVQELPTFPKPCPVVAPHSFHNNPKPTQLSTPPLSHPLQRVVDRAHAPVRGPGYSVFDPQLQLWVAAPL